MIEIAINIFKTDNALEKEKQAIKKQRDKKEKSITKFIKQYQKDIPEQYNQCEMLDLLTDDSIDHYMAISNRTDGKSFGYIKFFFLLSYNFDVGFTLIARHFTVRYAYSSFIMQVVNETEDLDIDKLFIKSTDDYLMIIYDGKTLGVITDLNNATDLKYSSNFLKSFPIMVYDEFLALESDYLPDEWERLKLIYTSIDRDGLIDYIHFPKIFYLGNAENFSSPVLSNLDLFEQLEEQPINTMKQYGNVLLEMRRNDNANEQRNIRAFKDEDDNLTTGQFKINRYLLAKKDVYTHVTSKLNYFYIKISRSMYIKVDYIIKPEPIYILSVITQNNIDYQFCNDLKDITENSTYLSENYYDEDHYKKFIQGDYFFLNSYSKDFILSHDNFNTIKLHKCIYEYDSEHRKPDITVRREHKLNNEQLERQKRYIYNKFFSEYQHIL